MGDDSRGWPAARPIGRVDDRPVVSSGVPPAATRLTVDEAAAIWSTGGVRIDAAVVGTFRRGRDESTVIVIFDGDRRALRSGDLPIGWIRFALSGVPEPTIHLSRGNALRLLDASLTFRVEPVAWKERVLARGLGRALAHELGHYLYASTAHAACGLMRARRPTEEFFAPGSGGFAVDGACDPRLASHASATR